MFGVDFLQYRICLLHCRFSKDEVLEMDFQAYLASSSDEDNDLHDENCPSNNVNMTEEEKIASYRVRATT